MRDYGEVFHYVDGDDDDAVNELGWYDENDEFIFYTDKELLDMEMAELLAKRAKKREGSKMK